MERAAITLHLGLIIALISLSLSRLWKRSPLASLVSTERMYASPSMVRRCCPSLYCSLWIRDGSPDDMMVLPLRSVM